MPVLGTTQTVLVCVPGEGVRGICPEGFSQSVTQAYLVAPTEAAFLDAMAQPFDPATAGSYFGFAFASTVFLYLVSLGCGSLIQMVRDA